MVRTLKKSQRVPHIHVKTAWIYVIYETCTLITTSVTATKFHFKKDSIS